jgi:hypothetical protein
MEEKNSLLEKRIKEWRDFCFRSGSLNNTELDELEDHLREEITQLSKKGLSEEESFLIAISRMGKIHTLTEEFRKVNTHNLWKQLFKETEDPAERLKQNRDISLIVLLTFCAVLLIEFLLFSGLDLDDNAPFFMKNLSFFVFPFITLFFLIKRKIQLSNIIVIISAFSLSFLLINLYPLTDSSHTLFLSALHLPLFLWFFTGLAYAGSEWREISRRMDFLRFTGETFIYTTLLCCGIAVISGLSILLFDAIDINVEDYVIKYFSIPFCIASPIIAIYLVDQKKSVVENFAPILAKIFAPLLFIIMLVFLGVMVFLQKSPFMERDFLISFDLMLILVLGIVFYIISTRDEEKDPCIYDWISLFLIIVSLINDIIALSAIIFRLGSFGISPNKLAALGENILIFINLFGMAVLFVQFFQRKISFVLLEKWQTRLLPFYAAWLGFVALLFPLIFKFK